MPERTPLKSGMYILLMRILVCPFSSRPRCSNPMRYATATTLSCTELLQARNGGFTDDYKCFGRREHWKSCSSWGSVVTLYRLLWGRTAAILASPECLFLISIVVYLGTLRFHRFSWKNKSGCACHRCSLSSLAPLDTQCHPLSFFFTTQQLSERFNCSVGSQFRFWYTSLPLKTDIFKFRTSCQEPSSCPTKYLFVFPFCTLSN